MSKKKAKRVLYRPDPFASPLALQQAIESAGMSIAEAALAIGIEAKNLYNTVHRRHGFPRTPEFVYVVVHALRLARPDVVFDVEAFPGIKSWASANPNAHLMIKHLAGNMVGKYGVACGRAHTGNSARLELFEKLRQHDAAGSDNYWHGVLTGREPFPRNPYKLSAIAAVLGVSREVLWREPSTEPDDVLAICRLLEAGARSAAGEVMTLATLAGRHLDKAPGVLKPVFTAVKRGDTLMAIASRAEVPLEDLLRLLLRLDGVADQGAKTAAIRRAIGLEAEPAPRNGRGFHRRRERTPDAR